MGYSSQLNNVSFSKSLQIKVEFFKIKQCPLMAAETRVLSVLFLNQSQHAAAAATGLKLTVTPNTSTSAVIWMYGDASA